MAFRSVPRPSSPPDAKASTERPYLARYHDSPRLNVRSSTHHAQEPSTPSSCRQTVRTNPAQSRPLTQQMSSTPLNTMPRSSDATRLRKQQSRSDKPTTKPLPQTHLRRHARPKASTTRPETHQNLIHTNKDHDATRPKDPHAPNDTRNISLALRPTSRCRTVFFSVTTTTTQGQGVPLPCKATHHRIRRPLPPNHCNGGGGRDRTDDPLLAKQVLSQLSYTPDKTPRQPRPSGGLHRWWAKEDLNLRPHAYQACALTS